MYCFHKKHFIDTVLLNLTYKYVKMLTNDFTDKTVFTAVLSVFVSVRHAPRRSERKGLIQWQKASNSALTTVYRS